MSRAWLLPWLVMVAAACATPGVPVAHREVVSGPSGGYSLTLFGPGWSRVPSGTLSDGSTDLELSCDGGMSWVAVYTYSDLPLDTVVRTRRSALLREAPELEYSERRSFLRTPDGVPISRARYVISRSVLLPGQFWIATAEQGSRTIEAVGYAGSNTFQRAFQRRIELSVGSLTLDTPGADAEPVSSTVRGPGTGATPR